MGPRVVVVGTGPMGARHALAFCQAVGAGQVAVACRDAGDQARVAQWGLGQGVKTVPFGPELAELFDLGVVAVQTARHHEVAMALPMPLLVEKPLAQTPAQAEALANRPYRTFVGHSSCMEAGAAPFHALVRQGRAGALREVLVSVSEPALCRGEAPLPMVAGRLYDVAVHAVALVADLFPSEPPLYAVGSLTARWGGVTGLRGEAVWWEQPHLTLDIGTELGESRSVMASGAAGRVLWQVHPGATIVGFRSPDGQFESVPVGGPDPQVALAREVLQALRTGEPSMLDAPHGLRTMETAGALVAAAVRAAGEQWDWGWVG
ncbi:MAG: Gfo/Idh/MocA family oxidoreductase [Deltaproteobacteria bacterium]|nr:Gfo/Idh/MocA family oxidoreductase [Deltaproteobacteria bacterium]